MGNMIAELKAFWEQALEIWRSGGWSMAAIALNSLVMFSLGAHVHLKLSKKGFQSVSEKAWRYWIDHPTQRKGHVGELLNYVTRCKTLKETRSLLKELRATEIAPFERDLRVMKVCVSASPLLGLLGTVTGMLATFGALAAGSGGEKTMGLVAEGISEALITTETGLVMALPGLFFQYQLSGGLQRYKMFLAHVETIYNQKLYKTLHKEEIAYGGSHGPVS